MKAIRRFLIHLLKVQTEVIGLEQFWCAAYEHGMVKAGYRDGAIPNWDNELLDESIQKLRINNL